MNNFVDVATTVDGAVKILRKTGVNHFEKYLVAIGFSKPFNELTEDECIPGFILGKFSDYLFTSNQERYVNSTTFQEHLIPKIWYNSHRNYLSAVAGAVYERFPSLKALWAEYVFTLYEKVDKRFEKESQKTGKPLEERSIDPVESDHEYNCLTFFESGSEKAVCRTFTTINTAALGRIGEVYFAYFDSNAHTSNIYLV